MMVRVRPAHGVSAAVAGLAMLLAGLQAPGCANTQLDFTCSDELTYCYYSSTTPVDAGHDAGSNACTQLQTCCESSSLPSTYRSGCDSNVSTGNAMDCSSELTYYQGLGYCSTTTKGSCTQLATCCESSSFPSDVYSECEGYVSAGDVTTCSEDLSYFEGLSYCTVGPPIDAGHDATTSSCSQLASCCARSSFPPALYSQCESYVSEGNATTCSDWLSNYESYCLSTADGGTEGGTTSSSVLCSGTPCDVPTDQCCATNLNLTTTAGATGSCDSAGSACGAGVGSGAPGPIATAITCLGSSSCSSGSICCLDVTSTTTATVDCQAAVACPASFYAAAQICGAASDCTNESCVAYSCESGAITFQACQGSVTGALATSCDVAP
jgi:hypothetical protein